MSLRRARKFLQTMRRRLTKSGKSKRDSQSVKLLQIEWSTPRIVKKSEKPYKLYLTKPKYCVAFCMSDTDTFAVNGHIYTIREVAVSITDAEIFSMPFHIDVQRRIRMRPDLESEYTALGCWYEIVDGRDLDDILKKIYVIE